MRVAMYYNNKDIRVEEFPTPKIGPGELLVRVEASGICGSDVMEWYRIKKAPLVLGHEIAGEVAEAGPGGDRYKKGDRIVASHHVPCNTCRFCLSGHHTVCDTLRRTNFDPGGFAEYVRLPAINVDRGVYLIPDTVSFEEASFTEPLACVLRAQRIAGLQPGETVLVMGCGIAGLLHIQLACAVGAGRVVATDISEARLDAAKKFGADAVIHAEQDVLSELRRVNDGWLADKVLVCTAARSANVQALKLVER
ncbi:MAG: alcohol dehydrogenase catalytic domain-containing protein, partial [Desulfobacterales bacterium]|nr:alcohol dehydrogenase catalytic domain-containing protein [Desulfobacterales bacterium]